MFRDLLTLAFHEQGPVEHFVPFTGTCWTFCAIYRDLLNILCHYRDLLNILCHLEGLVEHLGPFTDTCWKCRDMFRGLLNMSLHLQGPIEHILPQLQQDVRQFPCRGLLAFLHADRSHAEPQRHDSQVHLSLGKIAIFFFSQCSMILTGFRAW